MSVFLSPGRIEEGRASEMPSSVDGVLFSAAGYEGTDFVS